MLKRGIALELILQFLAYGRRRQYIVKRKVEKNGQHVSWSFCMQKARNHVPIFVKQQTKHKMTLAKPSFKTIHDHSFTISKSDTKLGSFYEPRSDMVMQKCRSKKGDLT